MTEQNAQYHQSDERIRGGLGNRNKSLKTKYKEDVTTILGKGKGQTFKRF